MTNTTEIVGAVRRADGPLTAVVGEELLMMSVEQGRYSNLNLVGTRIREQLAAPLTVDALVKALTNEYDIDPITARSEIVSFLGALRDRDLLVTDDAATP